ncbi:MAG: phosphoribosylformylglycinamidine synthase subunit PurL [Candidatus Levybacteria bacterium]|nr:phosphoribosylformylglycinamidine synthase subunit PurL [Candidatus Levybacteria bacterium]
MIQTIRVIQKNEKEDLKGLDILGHVKNLGINKVRTSRLYRLEGTDKRKAKILAEKLFCESINQEYSIDEPLFKNYSSTKSDRVEKFSTSSNNNPQALEIAYKPGVMNPEVASIIKAAKDLGVKLLAADSSWEYHFFGKVDLGEVQRLVKSLGLYNPLIEYIVDSPPKTLLIEGKVGPTNIVQIRNVSDETLMELSKDKLFLNLEEMKVIQKYFQKIKRDPTDCELETLAQTWSEHSGHKTFKAQLIVDGKKKIPLIERIKKEALKHDKNIVSAFVDNSGVMDFYDGWAICGKGETHNSPSAIEPYGGAMTGSGGVFRDIVGTGLGGKTLVSTDIFCFANPTLPKKDLPVGCLPPDYLLKRVVTGVRDYGNRIGIPTNNGSVHFHDDFRAKPTVMVGAYGILPKNRAQKGTPKKGDIIVSVGGRVGRDGIHGATFSSAEMTDKTISVNSAAVQIGNAIEEKRMFDAILEASGQDLIRAIQDSGGGGLSSAIGEMGSEIGVTIHLENERLKYPGLSPWEIWVSESQERMLLALSKNKLKKFESICKKYNVEISNLGIFDGSKKLNIFYKKKRVCDLDMDFLHNGLPQRTMIAHKPIKYSSSEQGESRSSRQARTINTPQTEKDWIEALKKVLAHGNVNSKEPIVRLYDHSVQGTNDLQPYSGEKLDGPNDAVVLRPFLDKRYGMVVSHGLNPILNRIDPYWGSIWAGVEALSNYVAVGGDITQASLINNYIWPFPDEESLWSLDRSVDGVVDLMKAFEIPVISGKDSLSSTYRKGNVVIKIPPVLCISVFGKIQDASKTVTSDFKREGSVICLVGNLDIDSMGGSVYFDTNQLLGSEVPKNDLNHFKKIAKTIYQGIQSGKILSCHDVSEGGLATAIFEMCVGGDCGASLTLKTNKRLDYFLFNETAGSFIVEVENKQVAKSLFGKIPFITLGKTQKEKRIEVRNAKKIFNADLYALKKAWQYPMQKLFA